MILVLSSANFIDNLQSIINYYMMISSYSVGISDLIADSKTNEQIATAITSCEKFAIKSNWVYLKIIQGRRYEEEFEIRY